MGTAVYGGSPRHNTTRRISVGGNNSTTNHHSSSGIAGIASHLVHSSPALHQHQQLQQYQQQNKQHQHQSRHQQQQQSHWPSTEANATGNAALLMMNHSNSTIIFPPPPTSFNSNAPQPPAASMTTTAVIAGRVQMGAASYHQVYQPPPLFYGSGGGAGCSGGQQQQHNDHRHSKRKSAVELLAESKPLYVKSETVLERQQQPALSGGGSGHQVYFGRRSAAAGIGTQESHNLSPQRSQHMRQASSVSLATGGHHGGGAFSTSMPSNSRRSASSSSDLLQTKLRSLLNQTSLDQNAPAADNVDAPSAYHHHNDSSLHYAASPKKHCHQELSVIPSGTASDQSADLAAFFPSAFLSPQSLPPHTGCTDEDDIFSFGLDDDDVDGQIFHTISPPAEYAGCEDGVGGPSSIATTLSGGSAGSSRPQPMLQHKPSMHQQHQHRGYSNQRHFNYQRSVSHTPTAAVTDISVYSPPPPLYNHPISRHQPPHHYSNTTTASNTSTNNDSNQSTAATSGTSNSGYHHQHVGHNSSGHNNHKSLPDLHSSTATAQQLQQTVASISRHSPHSEALSCCSRGARSNKSTGSSFNRDSGGSSGHYTHRSEPNSSGQQSAATRSTGSKQLSIHTPKPIAHAGAAAQQQKQQHAAAQQQQQSADFRRDSGSSTQHSGNSAYYAYGIPPLRYDCVECCGTKISTSAAQSGCVDVAKSSAISAATATSNCLLHFTTPEVPEAFQDNYQQQQQLQQQQQHHHHHQQQQQRHETSVATAQMMMAMMVGGKPPSSASAAAAAVRQSREKEQLLGVHQQTSHQQRHRGSDFGAAAATEQRHNQMYSLQTQAYYQKHQPPTHQQKSQQKPLDASAELSPPLGTFKRQRCMRVKQRDRFSSPSDRGGGGGNNSRCSGGGFVDSLDRRPILRSKSDVSDRHWQQQQHQQVQQKQQQQQQHQQNQNQQLQLHQRSSITAPSTAYQMLNHASTHHQQQQVSQSPTTVSGSSVNFVPMGLSVGVAAAADAVKHQHQLMTQLERFFERLGLQEDVYDANIAPKRRFSGGGNNSNASGLFGEAGDISDGCSSGAHSSPVFFSDASTVDSAHIVENLAAQAAAELAAGVPPLTPSQQLQQQQMYRPSEPPSIVERNARIIKWLCACRKSQLA